MRKIDRDLCLHGASLPAVGCNGTQKCNTFPRKWPRMPESGEGSAGAQGAGHSSKQSVRGLIQQEGFGGPGGGTGGDTDSPCVKHPAQPLCWGRCSAPGMSSSWRGREQSAHGGSWLRVLSLPRAVPEGTCLTHVLPLGLDLPSPSYSFPPGPSTPKPFQIYTPSSSSRTTSELPRPACRCRVSVSHPGCHGQA